MKLIRFGEPGHEKPGVMLGSDRVDVSSLVNDFDEEFFAESGLSSLLKADLSNCERVSDSVRLGPVIKRPSKIICVGLNFSDHAKESGMTPPEEPVLFFKASSALAGHNDDIISTGTPAGVGLGFDPPQYLKAGDIVELGIEGLGESRQVCRDYNIMNI